MLDGSTETYDSDGGEIAFTTEPTDHVTWEEADRQLRRCARARARLDVDEARRLLVAWRTDAHRHRGCATFAEYLERVLGYTPRAADDRMRVAFALQRYPKLHDAVLDGAIPFTGAREVVRVLTPATESAWIDAVAGRTVREVEALVSGREPGQLPTDPPATAAARKVLRFEVTPETFALYREAQRALADQMGHAVDDDTLLHAMADGLLAGKPNDGHARHQIA